MIKNATLVEMNDCPLEANNGGRYKTGTIYLKPETASSRVLVLDGWVTPQTAISCVLKVYLEAEFEEWSSLRFFACSSTSGMAGSQYDPFLI
jgi:hypothetical protein